MLRESLVDSALNRLSAHFGSHLVGQSPGGVGERQSMVGGYPPMRVERAGVDFKFLRSIGASGFLRHGHQLPKPLVMDAVTVGVLPARIPLDASQYQAHPDFQEATPIFVTGHVVTVPVLAPIVHPLVH